MAEINLDIPADHFPIISEAYAHEFGAGVPKDSDAAARYMFKALKGGYKFGVKEMTTNADAWSKPFRRRLQSLMRDQGVYSGAIDGSFGRSAKLAVRALARKS